MSNPRAVRYRRLALAETDRNRADMLHRLADEADKGILVTSEWITSRPLSVISDEPIIV